MFRFIVLTFGVLAWGYYELSGGSDFEPPNPDLAANRVLATYDIKESVLEPAEVPPLTEVARRDTASRFVTLASAVPMPVPVAQKKIALVPDVEISPDPEVWVVTGSRVNMRSGPGTNYGVLTQLVRGQQATVVEDPGNGWLQIRDQDTGRIGWMSARLLEKQNG